MDMRKILLRFKLLIKMPRVASLFLIYLFSFNPVVAQEAQSHQPLKHGIGFSGGYVLGTGLTYVRYMGPHMLQVSFIGDVDQDNKDLQAGFSYARYIHRVNEPRSLLPVALKFIVGMDVRYQDGFVDSDIIVFDEPVTIEDDSAYFYHLGAGLGIDIGNPGKPGLVLSLIVSYALSLEEVNKNREWELSPLPAIGVLYSW